MKGSSTRHVTNIERCSCVDQVCRSLVFRTINTFDTEQSPEESKHES